MLALSHLRWQAHGNIFRSRAGGDPLPAYDRVEREDYEVFTLEDACLCDATSMEVFLEDWDSFSGQLRQAMENMPGLCGITRTRRNHNGSFGSTHSPGSV